VRKKISNFPLDKPFETLKPGNEFQEICFPLLVNFNTEHPFIVGAGIILSKHLLLTARHVVESAMKQLKPSPDDPKTYDARLSAVQIAPGEQYQLWDVVCMWLCPTTDLAILQTESAPWHSDEKPNLQWKQPLIRSSPPEVGEKIAAFGYRRGEVSTKMNANGGWHHDLNSEHMASVGIVREIFETRRDSVVLPFPCYQVSARFDSGMSGGPLFDETGAICGLVCASVQGSHEIGEPISYACTLWPLFGTKISADRGDAFPRGIWYPMIELAKSRIVSEAFRSHSMIHGSFSMPD
jgi:S1-C subfamily serine protease